ESTEPPWKVRVLPICWWVATSHNHTALSPLLSFPPMARVPSALNATESTEPPGKVRVLPICWWVATSHSCTLPAELFPVVPPLARILPSGLNATDLTELVRPVRGLPIGWWVATSHNCTLPSALAAARVLLSGLKATDMTLLRSAIRGRAAADSIAYRASLEGLMRHAATLNSLEMTGSVSPRVSLSMISRRETATFCR